MGNWLEGIRTVEQCDARLIEVLATKARAIEAGNHPAAATAIGHADRMVDRLLALRLELLREEAA